MTDKPSGQLRQLRARDWFRIALGAGIVALIAGLIAFNVLKDDNTVSVDDLVQGVPELSLEGPDLNLGDPIGTIEFETLAGGTMSTAQWVGTPTILNFWRSDCVPCVTEMPLLEQAASILSPRVHIIGVNVSEQIEPATAMLTRLAITYPQIRDPQAVFARRTHGTVLPRTIVIDSSGKFAAERDFALTSVDQLTELLTGVT